MPKENKGKRLFNVLDRYILKESKSMRENVDMEWINHKKAYDMIPKS